MMGRIEGEEALRDAAVAMVGKLLKGRGASTQFAAWKRAAGRGRRAQRATPGSLGQLGIGFREVNRAP